MYVLAIQEIQQETTIKKTQNNWLTETSITTAFNHLKIETKDCKIKYRTLNQGTKIRTYTTLHDAKIATLKHMKEILASQNILFTKEKNKEINLFQKNYINELTTEDLPLFAMGTIENFSYLIKVIEKSIKEPLISNQLSAELISPERTFYYHAQEI